MSMNKEAILKRVLEASDRYERAQRAFTIARTGMENASHEMSEAESAWKEYKRGMTESPFIPKLI